MPKNSVFHVGPSRRRANKIVGITTKLEIINKLEKGVSVRMIMAQYNLRETTVYDILRSRERILGMTVRPKMDDKPHSINGSSAEDGGVAAEDEFSVTLESTGLHTPSKGTEMPKQLLVQHSNHLRNIMETLTHDETFVDVTLTAEGQAIKAHKLVLSAMSPFFKKVLYDNPCRHPVIIMPYSVKFDHLIYIIDYIYKGEITVGEDQLTSLLKSANLLQVMGLTISHSARLSNNNCLSTVTSPSTCYTGMNSHSPDYTNRTSFLSCSTEITRPLNDNSNNTEHQRGSNKVKVTTGSSVAVCSPTVAPPAGPSEDTTSHNNMSKISNIINSSYFDSTTFRGTNDVTNKVSRETVTMETDRALCMQREIRASGTSTVSNGWNYPVHDSLAAEPIQAVILDEPPVPANIDSDLSDQNISHPHKLQEQSVGDPTFNNSLPDNKHITFEEVEEGTKRRGRKLVRSDGFTYTVKRNNKFSTYWICSVRNKKLRCPANVRQYGDKFITSSDVHMHQACLKLVNNS